MQFYSLFMFHDAFFRMQAVIKERAVYTPANGRHSHNKARYPVEAALLRILINDIKFFFIHALFLLSLFLSPRLYVRRHSHADPYFSL